MNYLSILYLGTSILSLFIGFYVYFLDRGKSLNKVFFIFAVTGFYWSFTGFGLRQAVNFENAYLWMKFGALWPFAIATLFHFSVTYIEYVRTYSKAVIYSMIYGPALFFSFFELTTDSITTVQQAPWGWTSDLPSISLMYVASTLWAMVLSTLAISLCIIYLLHIKDRIIKKRTVIIILSLSCPIVLSALSETFLPLMNIDFPKLTVPGYILCLAFIGYAMQKYQLFSLTPSFAAENIISIIPDMLFITGLNGKIVNVNNTTLNEIGYKDKEQLYQMNILNLIQDPLKNEFYSSICLNYNDFKNKNLEFKTRNGGKIPVLLSKSVIRDDKDSVRGFVFVASNISELKKTENKLKDLNLNLENRVRERTERIKELLDEKDDFIHILGHDLKNPLGPLLNLLPILDNKCENDEMKEISSICLKNSKKIKSIIDDTLRIVQANDLNNVAKEKVELSELVDDVLQDMDLLLKENKIVVENNIEKNLILSVDRFQVEEVFTNLISNAVKYTPESRKGFVKINSQMNQGYVLVSVSDNGNGLTDDQKDNVFDKFYHVGKTRKGMNSTGLGLTICKRVIEKHGGNIWAESIGPGMGSVFYFTLPIKKNHYQQNQVVKISSSSNVDKKVDALLSHGQL